jgi:hypothetical protein
MSALIDFKSEAIAYRCDLCERVGATYTWVDDQWHDADGWALNTHYDGGPRHYCPECRARRRGGS